MESVENQTPQSDIITSLRAIKVAARERFAALMGEVNELVEAFPELMSVKRDREAWTQKRRTTFEGSKTEADILAAMPPQPITVREMQAKLGSTKTIAAAMSAMAARGLLLRERKTGVPFGEGRAPFVYVRSTSSPGANGTEQSV